MHDANAAHTAAAQGHCLWSGTGERAVEALKEMDQQIIPWFQTAAAELLKEMPAEKALALALAKITGNTELKVQPLATLCCTALIRVLLHYPLCFHKNRQCFAFSYEGGSYCFHHV